MKVKISCQKCGSDSVDIVANEKGTTPMYRCKRCGHKNNLFPQFGEAKSVEKPEEGDEDDEEGGEEQNGENEEK